MSLQPAGGKAEKPLKIQVQVHGVMCATHSKNAKKKKAQKQEKQKTPASPFYEATGIKELKHKLLFYTTNTAYLTHYQLRHIRAVNVLSTKLYLLIKKL